MPRLLVLADLHLDKWASVGRDPLALMPDGWFEQFEMVLIAGDLVDKPKSRLKPALGQIGTYLPLERLWVFPGNHCYYHHTLDDEDRIEKILMEAGAGFAQMKRLDIGGSRVLCCTLWTDLAHASIHPDDVGTDLARGMNDYRYIRIAGGGYRKARPSDTRSAHHQQLAWLRGELAKPHDGKTIIVTHHAPLLEALGATGTLAHAYGSDLQAFVGEEQPDLWLYGHTHVPHETQIGRTTIQNVSLGYPFDLTDDEARHRMEAAVFEVE